MGLLGWGYGEGEGKTSAFRDMFDGGGQGRSGDTFKGGVLSNALNMAGVRPHGYNDRQAALQQAAMQQPNGGGGGGGGGHQDHVQEETPVQPNYPNYAPPSSSSQLGGLLDAHVMEYLRANLKPQGMFTDPPYGEMGPRNPNVSLRMPSLRDPYVSGLQPINRPSFQAVPNPYERGFELPPHLFR